MLTHRSRTILGDIPPDWQAKPVRQLITEQFAGDWGDDEGEQAVSVMRSTNFTNDGRLDMSDVATRYFPNDKAAQFQLKRGDLLVERSGGGPEQPVGRIGFIEQDMPGATVSNFVQVLRPDAEKVDAEYLGWALFELQRTGIIERVQQQSTQMRNLNWRDYQRLLLPWPELPEQHRIAAALMLADDAIKKARAELESTRQFRRAAASEFLEKGLPLRHSGFISTKHWTLPNAWELVCVKHLLSDMDAGSSPMCESAPARPGQWGVLKVSAVSWDRFEELENKALPATIEPELAAEVKVGDIIVSRANTTELCGAVHRVHSLYTRLLLCDKTWRLHPRDDVNPDWLVAVLKHPHARKQIEANATGTSDSMKNIAKRDFRNVIVPRPPKTEQDEIAQVLNAIDMQTEATEAKAGALLEMKRSLLQNLLTGRLRLLVGAAHA
jgi:type I restriction enzyme S subunit